MAQLLSTETSPTKKMQKHNRLQTQPIKRPCKVRKYLKINKVPFKEPGMIYS